MVEYVTQKHIKASSSGTSCDTSSDAAATPCAPARAPGRNLISTCVCLGCISLVQSYITSPASTAVDVLHTINSNETSSSAGGQSKAVGKINRRFSWILPIEVLVREILTTAKFNGHLLTTGYVCGSFYGCLHPSRVLTDVSLSTSVCQCQDQHQYYLTCPSKASQLRSSWALS